MKHHAPRAAVVVALIGVACLVAACGSTRTVTTTVAPAPTVAHPCSPTDATMNCVLKSVPKPSKVYGVSPSQRLGVDFGWSGVSATAAKGLGARFGASYLSPDLSKNWTRALVNAYHAAGLKTVAVWESTASRAEEGAAAGRADALAAKAQAAALGNRTRPIDFAVDCDCAGPTILGYFQGVHSALGARGNAYGGYDQIAYLHAHGVVGNTNWQTYAWSGGAWLPASIAPLEQYLNGSSYDHDRAIAADYGQWPYVAPKPPNPRHWDWLPDSRRAYHTHGHVVHARERATVRNWDQHQCARPVKRNSCRTWQTHLRLEEDRLSFIAHHTGRHLRHVAKHPRWTALHYRAHGHKTTLGGAYHELRKRTTGHGRVNHW